VAVLRDTGQR